ncbi:hypothetical protein GCM10010324_59520 [Streptomyces hiroshimensis]|uniref:Uncharacterized protein n=1 Tax=Streptomyces hiroshimensis TaxID=66424 RepID=A0ABQ2Z589_9ACTN|nr:hypothetical protein GCM10010324_59520 [Streptomyces hiroshimensis]
MARSSPGRARAATRKGPVPLAVSGTGPLAGRMGCAYEPRVRTAYRPYFSFVPVERRSAHALVTRSAMLASASLPQVRGS